MSKELNRIIENYLEQRMNFCPCEATSYGIEGHDYDLDNLSKENINKFCEFLSDYLLKLEAYGWNLSYKENNSEELLDIKLLYTSIYLEYISLDVWKDLSEDPGYFISIAGDSITTLMNSGKVNAAFSRLQKFPKLFESGKEWVKTASILHCNSAIEDADGLESFINGDFLKFAQSLKELNDQDRSVISIAIESIKDFKTFLSNEILPEATPVKGCGRKIWEDIVRLSDGILETPEELRDAAKNEISKIEKDLEDLVGTENINEFIKNTDKNHPTIDNLLQAYKNELDGAKKFAAESNIINYPDELEVILKETPEYLRQTIFAAVFISGAFEKNPYDTIFVVTPPESNDEQYLSEHSYGKIKNTVVHEAWPGHHVQFMYQRKVKSLVRKYLWHLTYGEGWAHYSEELMANLGFGGKEFLVAQKLDALLRAVRALADVEVHVFNKSFEDVVSMYKNIARLSDTGALMETKRVFLEPGTVIPYTYGKCALKRLRDIVVKDGDSLKDFHNKILSFGSAPFSDIAKVCFGIDLPNWS